MKNVKILLSLFFLFAVIANVSALDFNLRPKGFVFIPLGEANEFNGSEVYSTGGGGELGFEADISSVLPNPLGLGYTFGIEAGMIFSPLQNDSEDSVSFYSAGGALGLYFFPLSRLFTRIDGAVGAAITERSDTRSDSGLYWRIGGEAGFRFTPGFTLAANIGWREYQADGIALNTGMYAGLTAQLTFQTGNSSTREGVSAVLDQPDPLYPSLMQLYHEFPAASIILRNNENAEIRDVNVFFRAGSYTASEFLCGTASVIPRGRSEEFSLLADFSQDLLLFTDAGRVMGEIVIRYKFLGQQREVVRAVTAATHNRNTVPPGDTTVYAAFISSTSPEVLEFARFIAGLERQNRRAGVNQNYQYAVWLLEGLRASGIRTGTTFRDETVAQYPAETLSFTTGTSLDLALLFASCLESTGKRSAIIQVPGTGEQESSDFLAAVSLGTLQEAGTLASNRTRVLIINDEVWMPLAMSSFNEGFTAAWTQGHTILNRLFAAGQEVDFVITQDAWGIYPPAPLPELGTARVRTDTNAATNAVNRIIPR